MNEYKSLSDIPFSGERAVIVNVHTLLCTTLAILSTRRYMDMPLLVIDCPLNGSSDAVALRKLQTKYDFDLICLPLRRHGDTLDDLFMHIKSEWIYLIDSDVEVLNGEALHMMRTMRQKNQVMEKNQIFGVGMKQTSGYGVRMQRHWYYKECMYIPYCCLNVALVREEIERGCSFNIASKTNLSKTGGAIRKVRSKLEKGQLFKCAKMADSLLDIFRKSHKGHSTDIIYYDTGGLLFETLQARGMLYMDWSFHTYPAYVTHFCGITRNEMYSNEPFCSSMESTADFIRNRLLTEYAFGMEYYESVS